MLLKTLLNRCYRFKRFVYGECRLKEIAGAPGIVVSISARKNSKPQCSRCGLFGSTYDHQSVRLFEFIPIWGMKVFFEYSMRRVSCPGGHIVIESVPWVTGRQHSTLPYLAFLASWAEDLPWKRVSERFRTSWHSVYRAVRWVVGYGLTHRKLDTVTAIGVDEIKFQKGPKYLTVVYQLDHGSRRLLWVGKERTAKAFREFFTTLSSLIPDFREQLKFVCSDMWKAYLKVIREEVPNALHILDRFHIQAKFSDALDTVRRQEVKRLNREGKDPVLAKSRWLFLKKRPNLKKTQKVRLKDLLQMNLRTVRAYLLVEEFEHFWTYTSPTWAAKFLKEWNRKAMYSKIDPIKGVAKMLRRHEELILNWFRARKQINNGISEGLNLNVKLAMRKARGYRSFDVAEVALFHQLGDLPKPLFNHQFW